MAKIVFFGSSNDSVTILQKLITLSNYQLVLVVTKPDKPFGRSQAITSNPVTTYCQKYNLPLMQLSEFNSNYFAKIKSLYPEIGLCVAFGPPFFSKENLDLYPYGIINIHPSPLPKYRGATPGPWQIINGEKTSAVTFFKIDELPDHGPIISQISFPISKDETSASFYQRAFELASNNLESTLNKYLINPNSISPQDHSQKTYFKKLSKEDGQIDWTKTPRSIDNFVRALFPWPIAWTKIINNSNNEKLVMKIFSGLTIENNYVPEKVQIAGKKPTLWPEIKKYYSIKLN